MNDIALVKIKKGNAFTNTWVIADGTKNTYKSVIKQVNKFRDDLLDLGGLKSYPVKRAELSDRQSLNSKRGRPFLIYDLLEWWQEVTYRRMLPT